MWYIPDQVSQGKTESRRQTPGWHRVCLSDQPTAATGIPRRFVRTLLLWRKGDQDQFCEAEGSSLVRCTTEHINWHVQGGAATTSFSRVRRRVIFGWKLGRPPQSPFNVWRFFAESHRGLDATRTCYEPRVIPCRRVRYSTHVIGSQSWLALL